MARGRIIDREIYAHEKLNELDVTTRYFYHGLIVWADDEGRIKAHPSYLKAKIFPADAITAEAISIMVDQLATNGLVVVYQVDNASYLQHPKWSHWQPLRKDRYHPSDYPSPSDGIPVGNQMATNGLPVGNRNLTQPNLTQPKDISKDISSDVATSNGHRPEHLEAIRLIWEEYITKLGKNPKILTLTNLRKNKGMARLAESLKKTKGNLDKAKSLMFIAIESLANSDWHMGRDPKTCGKKYDSWENNLFRSSEQFEKWLEQS